jgi:type IX secretion system PorP/SprF family membrane protein
MLLFISCRLCAQYPVISDHYLQNPFSVNPAATGYYGHLTAYFNFYDQWAGIKNSPQFYDFGLDGLVARNMGLGLRVNILKEGVFSTFSGSLNYAYRATIAPDHYLSFGISPAIRQRSVNRQAIVVNDYSDPVFTSNEFNKTFFGSGFGLFYNMKCFNLSMLIPEVWSTSGEKPLGFYMGGASYNFFLKDSTWSIRPSVFYRGSKYAKGQCDLAVMGDWSQKLWLQYLYRTNKDMVISGGIFIKGFGIAYAYEISGNHLSNASKGSHQIMVLYRTPWSMVKKKPPAGTTK